MSNAFTTFRAGLQTTLAAGLTSYDWHAGPPPSGQSVPATMAAGFVWVDRSEPDPSNVLVELITCGVRMYVIFDERLDPQTPSDPTPMEQAAGDLQTTLAPSSAGDVSADPWFFAVGPIQFDHDNGYIEAEVTGTRWNDAALS